MYTKTKRIENKKLLKEIREKENCLICGAPNPDPHHLISKGAGGDDSLSNLVPLCPIHHYEIHLIGKLSFAKKHESFQNWLDEI